MVEHELEADDDSRPGNDEAIDPTLGQGLLSVDVRSLQPLKSISEQAQAMLNQPFSALRASFAPRAAFGDALKSALTPDIPSIKFRPVGMELGVRALPDVRKLLAAGEPSAPQEPSVATVPLNPVYRTNRQLESLERAVVEGAERAARQKQEDRTRDERQTAAMEEQVRLSRKSEERAEQAEVAQAEAERKTRRWKCFAFLSTLAVALASPALPSFYGWVGHLVRSLLG